jgi:hypothetical protein
VKNVLDRQYAMDPSNAHIRDALDRKPQGV